MSGDAQREKQIRRSWLLNQDAWTRAVRNGEIESRERVTNRAIVERLEALAGEGAAPNMLDIGCGEGWLARAMAARGWRGTAIDAGPELIAAAKALSAESGLSGASGESARPDYRCMDYACLSDLSELGDQDVLVCNFSLLGNDSVRGLLACLAWGASKDCQLLIQTLHPYSACGVEPYCDGWRDGSWDGFSGRFIEAPPWYFRTLTSWLQLLHDTGWRFQSMQEPLLDGRPASLMLCAGKI